MWDIEVWTQCFDPKRYRAVIVNDTKIGLKNGYYGFTITEHSRLDFSSKSEFMTVLKKFRQYDNN